MVQVDQEVRERYMAHLREEPLDPSKPSPRFLALVEEMRRIDTANIAQLESIVSEVGWPSPALLGDDASRGAWLILQHAELPIQEKYFPIIKEAAVAGNVRLEDAAMLEDRILQRRGVPQKYGTQVVTATDGSWLVYAVEDVGGLDARRASVGLPPMDEYLRQVELGLGVQVNREALNTEK